MKKEMIGMICAIALAACPFEAIAGSGSIEQGWALFNTAQNAESLALCNNLLQEYPADPEKTPEILLLMSLNYDHIAHKSGKKEDGLSAKAAAETVTVKYPDSRQAAEAYFYLGEVYSGHVPVKIETDCAKALPMYVKAIQKADKQWVKDESLKGIERCEMRHSNVTRQPIEYVAKNQGRFITVQGLVFCTHDKSSFGYSFEAAENGYVVGLFVLNKSAGEIEKYAYRGWTDHGQLWDSRVFMSTSLSSGFPRAITLRNSQAGGNDVFHLSEFIDQDNYVIESEDPAFTVSFTSAYRDIFECNKK